MGPNQFPQVAHQPTTMESQEAHPEVRIGILLVQTLSLAAATTIQTAVVARVVVVEEEVTTTDPTLHREGAHPTIRVEEAWQDLGLVVEVGVVMVLLLPIILKVASLMAVEGLEGDVGQT